MHQTTAKTDDEVRNFDRSRDRSAEHGPRHAAWSRSALGAAIGLGLIAAGLAWTATAPRGPGLSPDAVSYQYAAESMVRGGSLVVPAASWRPTDSTIALTHFPPGYPLAMASVMRLGLSTSILAARAIGAASAFAVVVLMMLALAEGVGTWAAAAGTCAVIITPAITGTYLYALSEPMFLALATATLAALVTAPDNPWPSGVLAAAAAATRYVGASTVGAVVIWMACRPGTARRRCGRAAIAALPSALWMSWWALRTARLPGGERAIREPGVYSDGMGAVLWQGAGTLTRWLAPGVSDHWARVGCALLGIIVLSMVAWSGLRAVYSPSRHEISERASSRRRAWLASALLAACYTIVLVCARVLADPWIPFSDRLLAPVLLLATIAITTVVSAWWSGHPPWARAALALGLAVWALASMRTSVSLARFGRQFGWDYANVAWHDARVLDWVRGNATGGALFSNAPSNIYFAVHRLARPLPARLDARDRLAFHDTLAARRAAIIVFNAVLTPAQMTLLRSASVHQIATYPDGSVWVPDDGSIVRDTAPRASPQ